MRRWYLFRFKEKESRCAQKNSAAKDNNKPKRFSNSISVLTERPMQNNKTGSLLPILFKTE